MKKRYLIAGIVLLFVLGVLAGCSGGSSKNVSFDSLTSEGTVDLEYATQFSIEKYEGGYALITIADEDKYLMVPEDADVPEDVDESVTVIQQPFDSIYLAASSAMDDFRALDSLSNVKMTSTSSSDWSFEDVQDAIASGDMTYVGKYSSPDYETIVDEDCNLAIESTMIYHSPDIQEKLEDMGIPVMVEHSSYESDPLGRMEWIKLYGFLLGKEDEATEYFDAKIEEMNETLSADDAQTDKTVAFFYVSSAGLVNVRKPGDYISKMIEMAGGTYVLTSDSISEEDENALSTMNMQMEDFYSKAQDADILIYNSTIEGELADIDALIDKNALFADFKAVKEGNVWCTGNNMFQETTALSDMVEELYSIFHETNESDTLTYLHKLK